ncbi:NAD(P)-dependent glycerol-3-phosphate dehydrogenase [Erythrobacteraceae bacterium CFH 75059]|uniref:NAD(P)H-dependent glycerol-3-phosphate dehydrogenase n=1 Tax=Qipengyuania thermophila TaxID=2509361 RepID=UPI0010215E41|nr:NAD(P)H-dependent glycerol-3-phosphate dehydrogenase [Qipengyuania thermophila]TCD06922.1 NAD(P)-dependent glycerol-3-phosphate dehydrogenase [Erythrobacteraceae bacterium CFH 75059]
MPAIGVLGAGAWGTALAQMLASDGSSVRLWARDPALAHAITATRRNERHLPAIVLAPQIDATAALDAVARCPVLLAVVPAQVMRSVLARLPDRPRDLVLCSKGIERESGALMHEVARAVLPSATPAVLSGPTFAHEVAAGLPTAVTLACSGGKAQWERLSPALARPAFRPYYTDDLLGTEIAGAVKNVLAIASGLVDGLGLGQNARAAMIARGFAELLRLGEATGARRDTLTGLCGLGDLVLTCTSAASRNYSLGLALGRGETADALLGGAHALTEGAHTAPVLVTLAQAHGVELPIAAAVRDILAGAEPRDAVDRLLARPLRPEAGPDAATRARP